MEQQQLDPDLSDAVAWFNQLILDNSALRHRLADSEHARRALALENRDLQGRLEEGRRALAMLAAHVFGENAVGSPGMEMAVVCAGAETDVDVDAGVEMEMEMETEMDAGMDAGLEQRAAPTWRSSFDEQIAWQTAQDGMWRDGIADEPAPDTTPGSADFHGVYLKGLPRRLDLRSLCRAIRTGRVHRIFLYNSGPYKNAEALIAFVKPAAARAFYCSIQADGFRIAGHEATAAEVLSDRRSDYGVSLRTQDEIVAQGWTRCLLLENLPSALTPDVVRRHIEEKILWIEGKKKTPLIESLAWNENERTIQLNMAGIYLAQNVKSNLARRKEYTRVRFTYARDPCEPKEKHPATALDGPTAQRKELPAAATQAPAAPTRTRTPVPTPAPTPSLRSLYRTALLSTANPNPSCRKIVFEHLPHSPRLAAFTQHIRGGPIESIYLYTDNKPKYPAAIVIFKNPPSAWHCYIYLKATAALHATLIPFAQIRPDTRPLARTLPACARRCIRVSGLLRSLPADVNAAIAALQNGSYAGRPSQLLEGIVLDRDGRGAEMVFSQIRVARTVSTRLRQLKQYAACVFAYVRDPCEGDVESLFAPEEQEEEEKVVVVERVRKVVRFEASGSMGSMYGERVA